MTETADRRGAPELRRAVTAAGPLLLDAPERRLLAHDAGFLRVLGGPGTGKTTLLAERVARRLATPSPTPSAPARAPLVLVGDRRAAAALRERIWRAVVPWWGRGRRPGPRASRWCAACTPTRSRSCGATRSGGARHRRGCSPAPSRTRWSASCSPVRSTASARRRGGPPGWGPPWRRPPSPPRCATCCCAPRSAVSAPGSCATSGAPTASPPGRPPAGSSAPTRR